MSREGRGGSELPRSLRGMTAPITTDAQFVDACGGVTGAALELALAQFRRWYGRLERCQRELARRYQRRDAHPRVPAGPLRDRREDEVLRGLETVVEAMRGVNAAYTVVEEGVRAWAKERGE